MASTAGMSGWRGPPALSRGGGGSAPFSTPTRRPAGCCSTSSTETAPLVEGMSLEEAFMDVRGLEQISGTPAAIAERLRRRARERVGLAVSRRRRQDEGARQDGEPGREAGRPLGHRARSGGGVSAAPAGGGALGGRPGHRGQAPRPWRSARSVSSSAATRPSSRCSSEPMPRATSTGSRIAATPAPYAAGSRVARSEPSPRSRAAEVRGGAGRAAGFTGRQGHPTGAGGQSGRPHRHASLSLRRLLPRHALADAAHPTAGTGAIFAAARTLLVAASRMIEQRGITLLGITVANLSRRGAARAPLDPRVDPALDLAIDEIRERFGTEAIRRGSTSPSTPRHVSQV